MSHSCWHGGACPTRGAVLTAAAPEARCPPARVRPRTRISMGCAAKSSKVASVSPPSSTPTTSLPTTRPATSCGGVASAGPRRRWLPPPRTLSILACGPSARTSTSTPGWIPGAISMSPRSGACPTPARSPRRPCAAVSAARCPRFRQNASPRPRDGVGNARKAWRLTTAAHYLDHVARFAESRFSRGDPELARCIDARETMKACILAYLN